MIRLPGPEVIFAGGGFAVMAWKLAQTRIYPDNLLPSRWPPHERAALAHGRKPASTEYYRILDSARGAWLAHTVERYMGISTRISL